MIFRDLQIENSQHYNEWWHIGDLYHVRPETRTEEERKTFFARWRSGIGTLTDWKKAGREEVEYAEEGLDAKQKDMVIKRRQLLYDWWVEYRVQYGWMRNLREVTRYAPHQIKSYAQLELDRLELFLSGKKDDYLFGEFSPARFGDSKLGYERVALMGDAYTPVFDIRDPEHHQEGEAIFRYKGYLQRIVTEGLDQTSQRPETNALSFDRLWPGIRKLSENLTVEYRSRKWGFKEETYINYDILAVSGCSSSFSLRKKLIEIFDTGFQVLLLKLPEMDNAAQQDILEFLKDEIEGLKGWIEDGTYVREEDEHAPREEHRFRRFTMLKYKGDKDLHFVFDNNARKFMDYRIQDFAAAWEEGIDVVLRKMEHALNNLNLVAVYSEKAVYDVERILDNTFVIESAEGASQGTAFYLKNIGIITCDHCIRKEGDEAFYSDLVIYRGTDLGKKVRVQIIKSNSHLDIAILRVESGDERFLGEGLEKGDSDATVHLEPALVAGFPNYNFGDSGITSEGKVIGFRTISGVRHMLVSNSLVAGNSGGPALNKEGKVIGVVVSGADSFGTASATEKHGLLPINTLDLLV